jgi:hypothetical protein
MTIPTFLRPFLSALIAIPIRALAGWLAYRGFDIDEKSIREAIIWAVTVAVPLMAFVGEWARRIVDRWVNPANTASGTLADIGKVEAKIHRRVRRQAKRARKLGADTVGEPLLPVGDELDVPPLAKIPAKERGDA